MLRKSMTPAQGAIGITGNQRLDGSLTWHQRQPKLPGALAKAADQLPQMITTPLIADHDFQGFAQRLNRDDWLVPPSFYHWNHHLSEAYVACTRYFWGCDSRRVRPFHC